MKKGKFINRVGFTFITNEGYEVEIVNSIDNKNYIIKFEDGHTQKCGYGNLAKGNVKNRYHKSYYNLAFIGDGKYNTLSKANPLWRGMLRRCYCPNSLLRDPSYEGCSVDQRWHNFQNFAAWFEENYDSIKHKDFHLDKDLLVKGNKVYGPDTCSFVPGEINAIFTGGSKKEKSLPPGVYKEGKKYAVYMSVNKKYSFLKSFETIEEARLFFIKSKEEKIKQLANKYRESITSELYNVLINYKI